MNQIFNRVKFSKNVTSKLIEDIVVFGDKILEIPYYDADSQGLDRLTKEMKNNYWLDVVNSTYEKSNPWLNKIVTNSNRSDFIFLLPVKQNDLALDLGSGWGQVAIPLSRFCDVVAIEGNMPKLRIMKEIARQEQRNNILLGLSDILHLPFEKEQFNFIILNGVLEWVGQYSNDNDPIEVQQKVLQQVNSLLVDGGYLYIGIENKNGLKYLLGEIDDHTTMTDFTYLPAEKAKEVYKDKTGKELKIFVHGKKEYEAMLNEAGFSKIRFYGALPDYKLPQYLIDLSSPSVSTYFLEVMDFVDEHRGALDGGNSTFNKKLKDLYRVFSSLNVAELFYPSYAIIARKGK
jgi:ubiquinone/menaquinone biosynthesis C-methylase UbiE